MFFIGIFGIAPRDKKIREVLIRDFPGYPYGKNGELYKRQYVFSFFFIPLLFFRKSFFILLPETNRIFPVSRELGILLEGEAEPSVTVTELEGFSDQEAGCGACRECGEFLEEAYRFCPLCGKER